MGWTGGKKEKACSKVDISVGWFEERLLAVTGEVAPYITALRLSGSQRSL